MRQSVSNFTFQFSLLTFVTLCVVCDFRIRSMQSKRFLRFYHALHLNFSQNLITNRQALQVDFICNCLTSHFRPAAAEHVRPASGFSSQSVHLCQCNIDSWPLRCHRNVWNKQHTTWISSFLSACRPFFA